MDRIGTATIMFTDLVGSTALRAALGEIEADRLSIHHEETLGRVVDAHGGRVVKGGGDGIMAVFDAASDAVGAAIEIQRTVAGERPWTPDVEQLGVRIGLASGDVSFSKGDCRGMPVVEAARLEAAAGRNEILCSQMVQLLARGRGGHSFEPVGERSLKGIPAPVMVARVVWDHEGDHGPVAEPTPASPAPEAAVVSAAATDGPGIDQFVGRTRPVQRIVEALEVSAQGRPGVVFVSGEAGMGKTSLIRAALDQGADNALLGWGTCWHGEGAPAFWPWMHALDDLARAIGVDTAKDAAGGDADLLSVLIRSLGSTAGSHDDPERHRLLLLDATVRWLEAVAQDRHVVVVLDDLQWADPSSLDLLGHLVATPLRARLLVLGTYRNDELDAGQRSTIAAVVSRSDHIHIEGLSVDEVEALLAPVKGADVAAELAPTLHRRTGGHPLFVRELARLPDVGSDGNLPAVVTEAVARRLETLPEATQAVLTAAAVLGNRLFVDVLAEVTDLALADVIGALESAADAGIVREAASSELWFAHDVFRETLYHGLRQSRRIDLHGRIGAALAARDARGAPVAPADIARHLTSAVALHDPAPAIRWAQAAAADERRRSAFTEAAAHLRRVRTAIAEAAKAIGPDLMVALLMAEADDLARSGDPEGARTLLARARAAGSTPAHEADVALAVQRLGAKFAARRDDIIAQLGGALERVEGSDAIREARLTAALARELQHSVAEDRARAGPLSERALELGRSAGDDETLVACLLARHDALWVPGTGAERAELGREVSEVAGRLGDTDRLAEGLILEANGLLESGSSAFRPVLDRWLGLLSDRDEPRDRYMVLTRRTFLALIEDRRQDALELMEQAAALGEVIHEPDTGNVLMSQRVALSRGSEDRDELRRIAADAVDHWTGAPVMAHSVAAGAYAAAGDLDLAAREVATVADAGGWESEGSYLRSVLVGHLADAASAMGDLELCYALSQEIDGLVGSCGVNGAVVAFAGPFAHPAGVLAAALGERDRAAKLLDASATMARRLGAAMWVRRSEQALSQL